MLKHASFSALIGAALLLPGCLTKKCDDARPNPSAELQTGKWNWEKSTGGIAGGSYTPASTGKQQAVVFDNGTVRYFVNGQLTRTDTYTIQTGNCIHTGQPADLISYGSGLRQHFDVSNDELSLGDEVYDGFGHRYRRP